MFAAKKTKSRVKATQIENKKIIHTLNHTTKPIKEQKTILTIKIITDASFIKDTHQACCGYYILINNTQTIHGFKKVILNSVNDAEAYACILAINAIHQQFPTFMKDKQCYVEWLTDSLSNIRNLKNKDDTSLIATLRIITEQLNFKATHIKGHTYKMGIQEQKLFSEHISNVSVCNEKGFSKLLTKMGKPHLSTEQSVFFAHCLIDKVCGFLNRKDS